MNRQLAVWLAAFGENSTQLENYVQFRRQYGKDETWAYLIRHIRGWKKLSTQEDTRG